MPGGPWLNRSGHESPASYYEALHNNQTTWVVLSGPFNTRTEAEGAQEKLREHGIDCFITSS